MNVICKQAIHNREGKVAFYEIFLQDRRTGQYPEGFDPLKATSIAIDVLVEIGPELVGGGKLVFVNVPAIFLEASMFDLLSPKYVGIELVENKRLNNTLLEAIDILIKRGFKFCIDDFGFEKIDYLPLLNKCHFVKINIKDNPYNQEELKEVISILKSLKKGIIAKNIESKDDYENALKLGFEYFQGIYLSKPVMVRDTRTISFLKSTIIKLYNAIKEKNIKKVVEIIEKDVGVTYKLLRFVNSAYFPKVREFSNVEDAVLYLGLENVAKFVIVLALSDMFADEEEKKLWKRALFRASLAEKLAEVYSNEVKDKAYLMGLFSLSWEILRQKPAELARAVALDGEIVEAYENRLSLLGFILSLVELLEESGSDETIKKVAKVLEIPSEKVKEILEEAKKESERFID
ncbi:MAG: HDOD domain-containing protein [Aquificota bacterium]|jgi:EAL and modified HD-GYP domain-containing signal transduction protein|nr:MAG: HDOD domain-containing protein [Aquificota bacterium]